MDFIHQSLFAKINGGTDYQKQLLIAQFKDLYKIPLCKVGLDAFLSQVKQDNVVIELAITKEHIKMKGCCITNEKIIYHSFLRRFVKHLHFTIAMRKLDVGTLMHEITHALERISGLNIKNDFSQAIAEDLKHKNQTNINLKRAIEKILFKDLNSYEKEQHPSELIARFMQILAMSKEIGNYDAEFHFRLQDVLSFFQNSRIYIEKTFNKALENKILDEVTEATKQIKFSNDSSSFKSKLHSDHAPGTKWSNKIKSNF